MGKIVSYYCDRCGLTIPYADRKAEMFNLVVEHYSCDYTMIDKLICENCLNDLKDRWMLEGGDHNERE